MAICPLCKEEIDNDSCFCDQCGSLLYVCSHCHVIGKGEGKRCGQCGKELVAATSLLGLSSNLTQTEKSSDETLYLVCKSENIRLSLIDNAIIGRVNGNYVKELSKMIYISGTHAQLHKKEDQWSITDLNSRNGTKVNGNVCSPTLNITKGDIVRIANFYDFIVE